MNTCYHILDVNCHKKLQSYLYNWDMASWIVHLRIAENLLNRIPSLDESMFAVGNIAPDSGIPDEKWEHFNPPPEITHFQDSQDRHRNCADLNFYRQYLAAFDPKNDPAAYAFGLGYFFHLITDNLWSLKIGRPTKERFSAHFDADKDFIWEVKKDWYGLDFVYVQNHPESLFWRVFLSSDYPRDDFDFLPSEAVQQRITYIKDYYQRRDEEVQSMCIRPFIYLTKNEMDTFVEDASNQLAAIFEKICIQRVDTGKYASALALHTGAT
jgi:hypothetical protein